MHGDNEVTMLSLVMDAPSAMKRLGDDRELFDQIIVIFLEDCPELLQSARRALSGSDAVGLRRAAHSLKGLTATLSAERAVTAAQHLEQIAANGDLSAAGELLEQLTCRLAELNESLQAYSDQMHRTNQRSSSQ